MEFEQRTPLPGSTVPKATHRMPVSEFPISAYNFSLAFARDIPRWSADRTAGHAVSAATNRNWRDTCPELAGARRCTLVVVGIELGGRFGAEATPPDRPPSTHGWASVPSPRNENLLNAAGAGVASIDACSSKEPPTEYLRNSRLPAPADVRC